MTDADIREEAGGVKMGTRIFVKLLRPFEAALFVKRRYVNAVISPHGFNVQKRGDHGQGRVRIAEAKAAGEGRVGKAGAVQMDFFIRIPIEFCDDMRQGRVVRLQPVVAPGLECLR